MPSCSTKNLFFIILFFCFTLLFSITSKAQNRIFNIKNAQSLDFHEQYSTNLERRLFFEAFDKQFTIEIVENLELTQKGSMLEHEIPQRFFKGHISGVENSWVRLSKVNGIWQGAIFDGNELYFIDSMEIIENELEGGVFTKLAATLPEQIVVKASDIEQRREHSHTHTHAHAHPDPFDVLQTKLDSNFVSGIALKALKAANRQLNITIITDTEYAQRVNGDVIASVMSIMNIIDGIFESQVNVSIVVAEIIELSNNGPMVSTDAEELLNGLQSYVDSNVNNPGLVHLFTGKEMDLNTIGIAYLDTICSPTFGIGLSEAYRSIGALIAAHEIGHNFGAPHDNQAGSACSSTSSDFLMNPFINGSNQFSNCSLNHISTTISNQGSCLVAVDPQSTPTPFPIPEPTPNPTPAYVAINGELRQLISYGGAQDVQGTVAITDGGQTLTLEGNNWKAVAFNYQITPNTRLEFDFQSTSEGEIIAIGFDTDTQASTEFGFRLYGSQTTGTNTMPNFATYADSAPSLVRYVIPVGEFYTGEQNFLFFQNDDDLNASSHAIFSNITIYEGNNSGAIEPNLPEAEVTPSEPESVPSPISTAVPLPTFTSEPLAPNNSGETEGLVPGSNSGGGGSSGKLVFMLLILASVRKQFLKQYLKS